MVEYKKLYDILQGNQKFWNIQQNTIQIWIIYEAHAINAVWIRDEVKAKSGRNINCQESECTCGQYPWPKYGYWICFKRLKDDKLKRYYNFHEMNYISTFTRQSNQNPSSDRIRWHVADNTMSHKILGQGIKQLQPRQMVILFKRLRVIHSENNYCLSFTTRKRFMCLVICAHR